MQLRLSGSEKVNLLQSLKDTLLRTAYSIELYPYQTKPANSILESFARRDGQSFFIEMSRQSGKSELVCNTAISLAVFNWHLSREPVRIGIFAPIYKQTRAIFDRIRTRLKATFLEEMGYVCEVSNNNEIKLIYTRGNRRYQVAIIRAITAEPNTTIKGETLHLIIIDECQDVKDRKITEEIMPMGSATNATRVFIGTPSLGTTNRYFYDGVLKGGDNVFVVGWEVAAKYNPRYKSYVEQVREELGPDDESFRSQYELVWVVEVGRPFVEIEKLGKPYERLREAEGRPVVACIDVAKEPDSTVVTIIEKDAGDLVRVLDWLELKGTDYDQQLDIIIEYLSHFDLKHVVIDSVGVGDPMTDLFRRNLRCGMTAHKWDARNHHMAFTSLIRNYKSAKIEFPAGDDTRKTREYRRFIQQFQDLEREWKGNVMRCQHRDSKDAHDDYCSSLALFFAMKSKEVKILPRLDI